MNTNENDNSPRLSLQLNLPSLKWLMNGWNDDERKEFDVKVKKGLLTRLFQSRVEKIVGQEAVDAIDSWIYEKAANDFHDVLNNKWSGISFKPKYEAEYRTYVNKAVKNWVNEAINSAVADAVNNLSYTVENRINDRLGGMVEATLRTQYKTLVEKANKWDDLTSSINDNG